MIYLDYNASTPIDPAVREAMLPYLTDRHGNPSSSHAAGREVKQGIDKARQQVASLLGADTTEIIFTSGGTEANNQVIKGVSAALKDKGRHIITSAIEHPAVVEPCRFLAESGSEITFVGVDSTGMIDSKEVIDAIRPDTILISIMQANNEVGTIQPLARIAKVARERGVLVHTDAAQACGKIETDVNKLGVDFLSLAGHKVYAPQGIGALYIRRGFELPPLHHGAGHEGGRRSGTEPVPGIVGLGAAATCCMNCRDSAKIMALRDRLYDGLRAVLDDQIVLLGHPTERLPNTLAVGFQGRIGSDVLAACPNICASTGAACHAGNRKRSATLKAMNVPEEIAFGAVRLSIGRFTTEGEIDSAVVELCAAVKGSG